MGCFPSRPKLPPPTPPRSHSQVWHAHQMYDLNDNYTVAPVPSRAQEQSSSLDPYTQQKELGQFNPEALRGALEVLAEHQASMERMAEYGDKGRHVVWPE